MAVVQIPVKRVYADKTALSAWLTNLATDVTAGRVTGFKIYTITDKEITPPEDQVVGHISMVQPEGYLDAAIE